MININIADSTAENYNFPNLNLIDVKRKYNANPEIGRVSLAIRGLLFKFSVIKLVELFKK